MTPLRLIFMGTPDFAVPALEALVGAGHRILAVYTQPPRQAGRGKALRKSAVHEAAERHGLPVKHPESLKDGDVQAEFIGLEADMAVVAAYGLILPGVILNAPSYGCLNIHSSLLPRWRGAAPIQRAIMKGDEQTGITIMQMTTGLDEGPILMQRAIPIEDDETAGSLHDKLAALGAAMIVEAVEKRATGELELMTQDEFGATYAPKVEKFEGWLDFQLRADELDRRIRALTPWPGAWFEVDGTRIRVRKAEVIENAPPAPAGRVIDDELAIRCEEGALRPLEVQREGKGWVTTEELLRGFPIPAGTQVNDTAETDA